MATKQGRVQVNVDVLPRVKSRFAKLCQARRMTREELLSEMVNERYKREMGAKR